MQDPINNKINSGLDLVNIRNKFYFYSYRKMILANFLLMFLLGLIIAFFEYQKITTSGSKYFITTPDGVLIDVPPLDVNHLKISNLLVDNKGFLIDQPTINVNSLGPDLDNGLVIYWAKDVLLKMYDYDYINYRRALQDLRNYFSPGAHGLFMKALYESKNLESVKNGSRVVRATIAGDPIVKKVGISGKRYVWHIFIPVDVFYENMNDEPLIQKLIAKMWIIRISTLQSPFFGLSIVTINLEPR